MSARRRGGNSQADLFPRSKRSAMSLPDNHPKVVLTDTVDWCRLIKEAVVKQAVALGLADPKVAVADMTAQEAASPHPNEMEYGCAEMTKVIEGVNQDLGKATASVVAQGQRLRGRAVAARRSTSASGVKQAATSGAKCVMAVAAQREARSPTAEHEAMDVALETGQADQNGGLQRSIWNPKTPPFPAAGY